jgi:hypothetical protein
MRIFTRVLPVSVHSLLRTFAFCIVSQLIPQRFDLQHHSPANSLGAHRHIGLCAPGSAVQHFATISCNITPVAAAGVGRTLQIVFMHMRFPPLV